MSAERAKVRPHVSLVLSYPSDRHAVASNLRSINDFWLVQSTFSEITDDFTFEGTGDAA